MSPLPHSPRHVEAWLTRLYADAPGLLSVVHLDRHGSFRGTGGTVASIPAALERIARLDAAGARGIYLRTTTVGRPLQNHERGGASDSAALPGLWADVDFGIVGHKPGPDLPLPPDSSQAQRIVTESGLPAPSLWVHSGGGWYPWWLLDTPLQLTDETRPMAADISAKWQQALKRSAQRLGYDYGAGVGDLSRVLRIPGTVNRKEGLERPCQVTEDTGELYTLTDLLEALAAVAPPVPAPKAAPVHRGDPLGLSSSTSAFDALDQHVTFDDILSDAGFLLHDGRHPASIEQCWTRPGDPDSPCSAHTLKANPHVLVVHSELAGLPTGGGQRLTRGRVFAHLHHRGDERAAALDIFAAMAGRSCTSAAGALPLPRQATVTPIDRGHLAALEELPPPPDPFEDEPPPVPVTPALEFHTVAELRARVKARGPRRWLLRGVWPAGDYGVQAAEKKAQKTWNTTDLAVAVASGTPWLGFIEVDSPGPVLMFVGEGGEGNTLRRLDAAAEERGLNLDDLPIHVCTKAPHLNDAHHLGLFAERVQAIRPALVTLDPLYLAARGAELGDLYKMGALLETPQHICQGVGASLWVVHHFNRQAGKGAGRMAGAGPAEWGRVLLSATVKARHTDPETRATRVLTEIDIIGGEIPDQILRVNRRTWSDDPDDLDSPLHTETSAVWGEDDTPETGDEEQNASLGPAAKKLLEAIDATGGGTNAQLVDWIAEKHGHGLTRETVSRELNRLEKAHVIESVELDPEPGRWPKKTWTRRIEAVA